ncbi:MAG: helicase-related protein, partial [Actinomyces sp.]
DRTIDAFGCTAITGHRKEAGMPAAAIRPTTRLRPPDLVIQDELHLITGALGTTIGLFEVAVDAMTTWRMTGPDGRILPVRPLLVGSSATVRNARDQARSLYGRHTTVFPPQVLDASDTFFSHEQAPAPDNPGRLYLGLAPTGVRMTNAEIQVAQVLLAAGQLLLDRDEAPAPDRPPAADPYMTLVGYYSATRELAGMARYVQDDIQTAVTKGLPASRLPRRRGTTFGTLTLGELTSRIASADITRTLEDMALPFDVEHDTTAARARAGQARRTGKQPPSRDRSPYDIILATSMLQVGVDVSRLGLMLVVGQPKNTAEYIQASSRVGRDPSRPGLVVTLCNWVRPRDLAHFEQFHHYHETFYARVEPLSVTPLSSTSLERGLPGALVAATRVTQGSVPNGLNPERNAWMTDEQETALDRLVATMTERTAQAGNAESTEDARIRLLGELRTWQQLARRVCQDREFLAYEKTPSSVGSPPYQALIRSAESGSRRSSDGAPFVVANSMREVQPEINLLVSPDPARLAWTEPDDAPRWEAQSPKEDQQ